MQPDLAYAAALCHYRLRSYGPALRRIRILGDLQTGHGRAAARDAHSELCTSPPPPAQDAAATASTGQPAAGDGGGNPFVLASAGTGDDGAAALRRQRALRACFAVEAGNLAAAVRYEAGDEEGAR